MLEEITQTEEGRIIPFPGMAKSDAGSDTGLDTKLDCWDIEDDINGLGLKTSINKASDFEGNHGGRYIPKADRPEYKRAVIQRVKGEYQLVVGNNSRKRYIEFEEAYKAYLNGTGSAERVLEVANKNFEQYFTAQKKLN